MSRNLHKPRYEIVGPLERFEEEDNIQARGLLVPGTDLWKKYYAAHPELEAEGLRISKLPRPLTAGPHLDNLMIAGFRHSTSQLSTEEAVDGPPAPDRITLTPERATEKVKGLGLHVGADIVRIGPLNQAWVYGHVGKTSHQDYGKAINLPHPQVIVFVVGLNQKLVKTAPQIPIELETMRAYLRLASVATTIGAYIRAMGFSARAHVLRNYRILLPPVAVDAGVGELARHGIVINEKFGSAFKMAAVTTDLPLVNDPPVNIGVAEFCRECRVCAEYCPVKAIPAGDKQVVRGINKWKINDAACYSYWRHVGSDCGVCVSVCPWTRPRTFPHNIIQWKVERFGLVRKLAILGDRLFDRKTRTPTPPWFEEQEAHPISRRK